MKFLKSISLYSLSMVLSPVLGFMLLPIMTKNLTQQDMGEVSLITNSVLMLTALLSLGQGLAFSVDFFKVKSKEIGGYLFSSMIIPCLLVFLCTSVFFFFSEKILELMNIPLKWLLLLPLMSILNLCVLNLSVYFQSQSEPYKYFFFRSFIIVGTYLLAFYLFFKWEMNEDGRLVPMLIFNGLGAFIFAIYFLFKYKIQFNSTFLKNALSRGVKLLPMAISLFVINLSDRFFISNMIGIEDLGDYEIAYKVASLVLIVAMGFEGAWQPYLFSRLEGRERSLSNIDLVAPIHGYIILSIFALIGVSVFIEFLFPFFIHSKFNGAIPYVLHISLGYVFLGLYQCFSKFIQFESKRDVILVVSIIGMLLNLILNYVLIDSFGLIGAAYATNLSFLLMAIIAAYYANRSHKLPLLNIFGSFKLLREELSKYRK